MAFIVQVYNNNNGSRCQSTVLVRTDNQAEAVNLVMGDHNQLDGLKLDFCVPVETLIERHVLATLVWFQDDDKCNISLSTAPQPLAVFTLKGYWTRVAACRGIGHWSSDGKTHSMKGNGYWLSSSGIKASDPGKVSPYLSVVRMKDDNRVKFQTGVFIPDGVTAWRDYARKSLMESVRNWVDEQRSKLRWLVSTCEKELES